MRGDGFGLACPLKHEELRKNGHRFEPDGKRPKDLWPSLSATLLSFSDPAVTHLCECVLVREQYRQNCAGSNEVLYFEGIEIGVVGRLVVVKHQVDGVRGAADKDDLEDGVVERFRQVEGPEKVDVSCHVYNEVEELRLERDAGRALLLLGHARGGGRGFLGVRSTTSSSEARSKWRGDGRDPLSRGVSMRFSIPMRYPRGRGPLRRVWDCRGIGKRTQ